jgi:hypothetical protein
LWRKSPLEKIFLSTTIQAMPKHRPVTQTPAQIRAMAEELARTASELRLYADAVEQAEFSNLAIR